MNINFDRALENAKSILNSSSDNPNFSKYSRGYLFTSEYISRYLPLYTSGKTKALTVLSSGDHVFDLLLGGIEDIDTFDINELNYFTFWLKYAFILNIDFYTFKSLSKIIAKDSTLPFFSKLLEKSRNDMPEEVYEFFTNLIYYQYSLNMYNGLRSLYLHSKPSLFSSSSYLKSKKEYLRLRDSLARLNINFNFQDAKTIPSSLSSTYDLILLSNISDYLGSLENPLTYEEFKKYISSFLPFLKDDGVIINYLYGLNCGSVINNSNISLNDLGRENVRRLTLFGEGYFVQRGR